MSDLFLAQFHGFPLLSSTSSKSTSLAISVACGKINHIKENAFPVRKASRKLNIMNAVKIMETIDVKEDVKIIPHVDRQKLWKQSM